MCWRLACLRQGAMESDPSRAAGVVQDTVRGAEGDDQAAERTGGVSRCLEESGAACGRVRPGTGRLVDRSLSRRRSVVGAASAGRWVAFRCCLESGGGDGWSVSPRPVLAGQASPAVELSDRDADFFPSRLGSGPEGLLPRSWGASSVEKWPARRDHPLDRSAFFPGEAGSFSIAAPSRVNSPAPDPSPAGFSSS